MGFAETLREVRKERNISQEDLADLLNVSRQAVSKWEQGSGYPEMEKMITLAQVLNVSLDFLVYGEQKEAAPQRLVCVPTGKITIRTHDGSKLVNCVKVVSVCLSNAVFKSKADEPKYVLFGVENSTFWGENKLILGWYADETSIRKELDEIYAAMDRGKMAYELQFKAEVKEGFLSVKLI